VDANDYAEILGVSSGQRLLELFQRLRNAAQTDRWLPNECGSGVWNWNLNSGGKQETLSCCFLIWQLTDA